MSRQVQFNDLPAAVRTRLVRMMRGAEFPPLVQSIEHRGPSLVTNKVVVSVSAAALALLVWQLLSEGIPALWQLGLYGMAAALTLGGGVLWLRRRLRQRALPYAPGQYLFAFDLVDARTEMLTLHPTSELKDVHDDAGGDRGYGVKLSFDDDYSTMLVTSDTAATVSARLEHALKAASQVDNARERMDPFFELRDHDNWDTSRVKDDGAPRTRLAPRFVNPLLAIALGAAIGGGLFYAKVVAADHSAWRDATDENTADAYMSYLLTSGSRHRSQAKTRYERRVVEERNALARRRIRGAYSRQSIANMRDALFQFRKVPEEIVDQGKRWLADLYKHKLQVFFSRASHQSPALIPFMKRLFVFLEKTGRPKVLIQFNRPSVANLTEFDELVARDKRKSASGRPFAAIAPHFGRARLEAFEVAIASNLRKAFAQLVDKDIMVLKQTSTRNVTGSPVLSIDWDVKASNVVYSSKNIPRVFLGIELRFRVLMKIPNDPSPFDFALVVRPPSGFSVSRPAGSLGDIQSITEHSSHDQRVYGTMVHRAFDRLDARLRRVFFRPPIKPELELRLGSASAGDKLSGLYSHQGWLIKITRVSGRVFELIRQRRGRAERGIGLWTPPYFNVAWGDQAKRVALYDTELDKPLRGAWLRVAQGDVLGFEGGARTSKAAERFAGTWKLAGVHPDKDAAYTAILTLTRLRRSPTAPYTISWVGTKQTLVGVAFHNSKHLVAAYGADGATIGVASYKLGKHHTLTGRECGIDGKCHKSRLKFIGALNKGGK